MREKVCKPKKKSGHSIHFKLIDAIVCAVNEKSFNDINGDTLSVFEKLRPSWFQNKDKKFNFIHKSIHGVFN